MIQKIQTRRHDSSHPSASYDHMNWGTWVNDKHYSLQVIQHPLRARMCGFGDKDRRPLAPAAVAKMIVVDRNNPNHPVPVDDVDVAFFIVTVDLWSEDGQTEMNLVLHPSSGERYVGVNIPRPKRTKGQTGGGNLRSAGGSPVLGSFGTLPTLPTEYPSYPYQGGNASSPPSSSSLSLSSPWSSYPNQPPPSQRTSSLPSIQTLKDAGNEGSTSYRAWGDAPPGAEGGGGVFSDANLPDFGDLYYTYPPPPPPPQHSSAPPPAAAASAQPSSYYPTSPPSPPPMPPQQPRHHYARTLVGPLSANACRLQDEHRKSGIFFLFQDLSVRTEGTFRLRMRLMCVGAPPAPEWGATAVSTTIMPVLAQTFSEPFVVYSAKRFPGVPDTTALSIAFGNQGQKLPLRNRNGSSRPRGRRGGGSDDEDDDDDD